MESHKKITLADVAAVANVTPATVSMVLNRKGGISAATASLVWDAVKQTEYSFKARRWAQPSRRRWSKKRFTVLTFPFSSINPPHPVYLEMLQGLETAAAASGVHVDVQHVTAERFPASKDLKANSDAIVFCSLPPECVGRLPFGSVPLVQAMGWVAQDAVHDIVSYENGMIGELAADYLIGKGCRRAVVVSERLHQHTGLLGDIRCRRAVVVSERAGNQLIEERTNPFLRRFGAAGGCAEVFNILKTEDGGWRLDPRILAACGDAGIYVQSDELLLALFAMAACSQTRFRPETPIVVCNNVPQYFNGLTPRPVVVDIQPGLVGAKVVEQIFWRLENPQSPPTRLLVKPRLLT